MKILILNITYNYKLYNFFDIIKNKISYKENVEIFNLYNDVDLNFIPQINDFFYKNKYSEHILNFSPVNYNVQTCYEMFEKFYFFVKNNVDLNNYDYVIRCNSSTFINFLKLPSALEKLPKRKCYAGMLLPNSHIVSGTCNIFTPDVLKELINTDLNNISYKNNYDDVSIADFMNKILISPIDLKDVYYSFDNNIIPDDNEIKNALNHLIIRIRNDIDRENIDIQIWNSLFKEYNNIKKSL